MFEKESPIGCDDRALKADHNITFAQYSPQPIQSQCLAAQSRLFPLRPVQQLALDGLRQSLRSGKRRPVIQAPTGFGKTILAAHVVDGALVKRRRVAFVAPFVNLIDQTFDRFRSNGIDPAAMGVMQADHPWRRPNAPVQICSVQTLAARWFPQVDMVIVDECHLRFKVTDRWMDECPDMIFVGLSATPWAPGMGDRWDDLIVPTSIAELVDAGLLSRSRTFAPSHPGLSGIKTVAGDYHEGQLSERMSDKILVADVVTNWLQHGEGRQTLVFCVDRPHAAVVHEGFASVGVASAYIDANTSREERVALTAKFRAGEIKVICSVGTMTTGVDLDVRCIIFARPTKSEILFVQCIGRGLRTADGKRDLLIFDHSDTTLRLGMVTDICHDKLRTAKDDESKKKAKVSDKTPATPRECVACKCLMPPGAIACPSCGKPSHRPSAVIVKDGELEEIGAGKRRKPDKVGEFEFYSQLRGFSRERGYAEGWAAHKFRAKFGVWPNGVHVVDAPAKPCGADVRAWIRGQVIKHSYALAAQKRAVA